VKLIKFQEASSGNMCSTIFKIEAAYEVIIIIKIKMMIIITIII
jgi:hypothetical protein